MKNEKKIYLQSPWKTLDSTYYKFLRESPPRGVKYYPFEKAGVLNNAGQIRINNFLKQLAKKIIKYFYYSMPNAHYTPNAKKYDLIHCAHCLSMNKKPWVCDIEFVGQFWARGNFDESSNKKKIMQYVGSKYCKKILAWSECSKKGILAEFPGLKNKVEVLFPALPSNVKNIRKDDKIRILFVGRDFEVKGGTIVVEILDKLTKKYKNIEGIVISDVPMWVLNKYKNSLIKFYGLISHKKLFEEFYPNVDIFLYPTFSDTLGFAILEAQSFGLPVVSMKTKSTHTIEETITDGKTGFIIENMGTGAGMRIYNKNIIDEISRKIEMLIKDKKLLRLMGKNAMEEIKNGKFSIRQRNKKLERIYREAIGK